MLSIFAPLCIHHTIMYTYGDIYVPEYTYEFRIFICWWMGCGAHVLYTHLHRSREAHAREDYSSTWFLSFLLGKISECVCVHVSVYKHIYICTVYTSRLYVRLVGEMLLETHRCGVRCNMYAFFCGALFKLHSSSSCIGFCFLVVVADIGVAYNIQRLLFFSISSARVWQFLLYRLVLVRFCKRAPFFSITFAEIFFHTANFCSLQPQWMAYE